MKSFVSLVPLLALLISFVAVAEEEAPRGLLPTDFYQEKTISGTALSPDGSLLAFVVASIDEEKNKRRNEIWMQPLKRGAADGEAYRFSNPTVNASGPKWSPDGKLLSFQSKRGEEENTTWFIRVTAPGGEAYQIDGVEGSPVWSPDGKWIAYVKAPEKDDEDEDEANEDDDEKPKAPKERDGWVSETAITDTLDAKRFDGRVYTTMRTKRDGTQKMLANPGTKEKKQIFVVSATGGEATQVTTSAFDVSSPRWTGDSKHILFSGNPLQDDEYNEELTNELYVVSTDGEDLKTITSNPGSDAAPTISEDGTRLAWLRTNARGEQTDILVASISPDGSLSNDTPANLTVDWNYSPGAPSFHKGNKQIRWSSSFHGNRHVFESDLRGNIKQITDGDRMLGSISYDDAGRYMAYSVSDPLHPSDLFIAKTSGSGESQLTHFNDEWLEDIVLVDVQRLTWTVDAGDEIEGWLIPPRDHTPGTKAPMILKIHGGPHGAYGNVWFRTFHVLSEAGFFVLYTNPRGSTGYGHAFTYATREKWGLMDSEDYLKGVDAAIAANPDIDGDRVGVSGGSYGGFMTAWLTSTTDRFAAANPSRMIVNWESWYGTSDVPQLTEWEFDGKPWEIRDVYRELSPLSYVENVVAPTLIIHSENDYRTPIPDAEQWYISLKKRHVPVEMVRYPRSSHGLSRGGEPWLLVDRLQRIKTWFQHWLIEEELTHQEAKERYGEN
ncbi:MAG: S9 family peptidase [Candidatus Hydrogenedentota bacterium]